MALTFQLLKNKAERQLLNGQRPMGEGVREQL